METKKLKIDLREWKDSQLRRKGEVLEGRVAYGVIDTRSTWLLAEYMGETAQWAPKSATYWFVNSDQSIKVQLPHTARLGKTIYALDDENNFIRIKRK